MRISMRVGFGLLAAFAGVAACLGAIIIPAETAAAGVASRASSAAGSPTVLVSGGYVGLDGQVRQIYATSSQDAIARKDGVALAAPVSIVRDADGNGVVIEGDGTFPFASASAVPVHIKTHAYKDSAGTKWLTELLTRKSDGAVIESTPAPAPLFTLLY